MPNPVKYDQILDALGELLKQKSIQTISVSEIAQTAGIGKGSIYYYFPSKDAIYNALVERSYKKSIETAKNLKSQQNISPFTRMAMIFRTCRDSSTAFLNRYQSVETANVQEHAYFHHKYMAHLISELKPVLTDIIAQGTESGDIHFSSPAALAEIVLIILTVKLDNTLVPSTPEEIEETLVGMITLLEKGTENPTGSLNFLTT